MKRPLLHLRARAARARQAIFESPSTSPAFNDLMSRADGLGPGAGAYCAKLDVSSLVDVDISVVTYNSSRWVEDFVGSLMSLDYPHSRMHVYFVDNGSSDGTLDLLRAALEHLSGAGIKAQLTEQPNLGFGAGHNVGVSRGTSAFALVTNIDLTFEPDALRRIVSHALVDQPEAAAWEMRQKPYEHPKIYEPLTGTTNWNSHACVLLRRSAFEHVAGYSPDLFMYGEDVELSYRLRANGFLLRYNPHAIVHHYTYEHAGEVKPLQFLGSTFSNLYMRLRYGTLFDIAIIPILIASLLLARSRFDGARWQSLSNVARLLPKVPALLRARRTNPSSVYFPFAAWDFDLTREGAFHDLGPLPQRQPKISVITRSFKGREALLRQAMASVAGQTYGNIEHLITEDRGNTLAGLVSEYAAAVPFKVTHVTGNRFGRSDAGNLALGLASGSYCIFLDDDDQFYPDHLETLVCALRAEPDTRAAYSLAFDVPCAKLDHGVAKYKMALPITHAHMKTELNHEAMKTRNFLPIQSVLFEHSLFIERGGFDEDLEMLEDWALWQKYLYRSRFAFAPKTTSFYRTPLYPSESALRMQTLRAVP